MTRQRTGEVFFLGRWRSRVDAAIRLLNDPTWRSKRGPPLEFSTRGARHPHEGAYVIEVRRGSSVVSFYDFEDPIAAVKLIKAGLK